MNLAQKACPLVLLLALCTSSTAKAEEDHTFELDTARNLFSGEFHALESRDAMNRYVGKAVNSATSSMSVFTRGTARKKLRELTHPCTRFSFEFPDHNDEPHALIRCEERIPQMAPADGRPMARRGGGENYRLTHEVEGHRIVQTFRSSNGTRQDVYEVVDGGTRLIVNTRITSKWLKRAVEYELEFERAER